MTLSRRLLPVVVASLIGAPATRIAAQQPLTPEPIAESAPTAQRARAVAELVLAGDQAKLVAYLNEHATDTYKTSPTFASGLATLLERTRTGARTIVRMDGLGSVGVGVALGKAAGAEPERAIVVRLEPEAPHRVASIGMAIIGPGGGGDE